MSRQILISRLEGILKCSGLRFQYDVPHSKVSNIFDSLKISCYLSMESISKFRNLAIPVPWTVPSLSPLASCFYQRTGVINVFSSALTNQLRTMQLNCFIVKSEREYHIFVCRSSTCCLVSIH